jgi:neutral ceramidase
MTDTHPVGGLYAAAAKVDITPREPRWLAGYAPRKSTGVRDPLYHRVMVLTADGQELIIASSELCLVSPSLYDEVAARLREDPGLDPDSFWWTVTHTHSAPEVGPPGLYGALLGRGDEDRNPDYTEFVVDSLVRLVAYTRGLVEPAVLRLGRGRASANINRRSVNVDGSITLGLNPDGPVDREFGLLQVQRPTGELIGLLVNYAMHGTVLGNANLLVSGDAPGTVMNYLEARLGTQVLYVNGAAGDLAPIYTSYPDAESAQMSQFNVLLGNKVLDALDRLTEPTAQVPIRTARLVVRTPARPDVGWPAELSAYRTDTEVLLPVRVARVGEAVLWAAPVELFCEINMAVRERVGVAHTFFCGYANGWLGYLPTARAFAEGGYEPGASPFTPAAEEDLLRAVPAALRDL